MELVAYHQLRTAVQQNAAPGVGAQLSLIENSLRNELKASGLFTSVEVEQTEDPDKLVIGLCEFRPELDEQEVAKRLEDIWRHAVAYQFWEAHSTFVDTAHVEFESATRPDSTGRYVTVHLVAQKSYVPTQRAAAE